MEARLRSLAEAPVLVAHGVPAEAREGDVRALGLSAGQEFRVRIADATRSGWWLVAVPVAYSWIQTIEQTGAGALSSHDGLGLLFLAARLVDQATVWPIAAWCFVALFPVIPGPNGPVKGLVAATAFAVPSALATPLVDHPLTPIGAWWFVSAELALLFAAMGVLLDYNALRRAGTPVQRLGELYRITNVSSALVYLSPLAALVFAVVQQLRSGDASAMSDFVNHAADVMPSMGGP